MDGILDAFAILAIFIVGLVIYLIPGIIAAARQHPDKDTIWALNIFLGWTFFGWVGALYCSVTDIRLQ